MTVSKNATPVLSGMIYASARPATVISKAMVHLVNAKVKTQIDTVRIGLLYYVNTCRSIRMSEYEAIDYRSTFSWSLPYNVPYSLTNNLNFIYLYTQYNKHHISTT